MLEEVFKLYPEYDTLYGPYQDKKDLRSRVVLYNLKTKSRRTIAYPKLLIELSIGRILVNDETVDHKDENVANNSIDNLQIMSKTDNILKSLKTNVYQNSINKYGKEKYKEMMTSIGRSKGHLGGKANKGIPKSSEHKRKISESLKRRALTQNGKATELKIQ